MVSEHKDEMDQDIVDYVETDGFHDEINDDHVSPSDDVSPRDDAIYKIAEKITIGDENIMDHHPEDYNDDDDDDIYGDPDQIDENGDENGDQNGAHGNGYGHGGMA